MNWFYLAAGALTLFLSIAHAIWGQKTIIAELKDSGLSEMARSGFFVSWHQTTAMLFITGLTLILMALGLFKTTKPMGIFILCLVIGNFLVFTVTCVLWHRPILVQTLPQTLMFVVLIVLIAVGIIK
jgi:hypothetical protein